MKYNLKEMRIKLGLNFRQMEELIGLKSNIYSSYEKRGEIPSKYIYLLWKKTDGQFELPEDFFYYTSYTLLVNMKLHNLKQVDIVKMFKFRRQSTVSAILQSNIPMYEKKEYFAQFSPLYIPATLQTDFADKEMKRTATNFECAINKIQNEENNVRNKLDEVMAALRKLNENNDKKTLTDSVQEINIEMRKLDDMLSHYSKQVDHLFELSKSWKLAPIHNITPKGNFMADKSRKKDKKGAEQNVSAGNL